VRTTSLRTLRGTPIFRRWVISSARARASERYRARHTCIGKCVPSRVHRAVSRSSRSPRTPWRGWRDASCGGTARARRHHRTRRAPRARAVRHGLDRHHQWCRGRRGRHRPRADEARADAPTRARSPSWGVFAAIMMAAMVMMVVRRRYGP
jgi:hypothetical protein